MLENASRSYRCTCLAHACTAFSLFTHRSSRLQLSLASVHPRSGRSSWRTFCVHRCSSFSREHVACVTLKYAPFMLPCSRTPCAHRRSFLDIPATALRSSSLFLATALCTLIVHSSSLIVAHPIKHRAFIHARTGEALAFVAARPCSC